LFCFFFVSGFCSLVYQIVWTRLAFASFGIITPVLSVVISVFMMGLSIGSWLGGRFIVPLVKTTRCSAVLFYAAAEFIIGLGAYAVPKLFSVGERILLSAGQTDSVGYLCLSAVVLAVSVLPWCLCMGVTFPFMMAYLRERSEKGTDSFSYLYVANVLGAMCGAFFTAVVFVEVFGFHTTLQFTAVGNFGIALFCVFLALRQRRFATRPPLKGEPAPSAAAISGNGALRWILFSTGFSSMAMEVVWTRLFTPILKTQVYSFALIVVVYLGATLAGTLYYRRHMTRKDPWRTPALLAILIISALLPIPASDPRLVPPDLDFSIHVPSALAVLVSIIPICAVLGYLTPGLVDRFSRGNPAAAGKAYAINVLGCILGPLVASYLLLPLMSERSALLLLSLPFLAFYLYFWKSLPVFQRISSVGGGGLLAVYSLCFYRGFAGSFGPSSRVEERRDYAASVLSVDDKDLGGKGLLVNGVGITSLTPITKFMAHLPLAFHEGPPQSVLVICFGMGTTYRSALSWGVDTTVVELVPEVPNAFGFYYADAAEVLKNPKGHIVIDDGRRFLQRTKEKYDVIVVDPPPPVEAAGSSLLYSTEFYASIKQHLKPNGILQTWWPGGEKISTQAVIRPICKSFPYTVAFQSIEGWGIHFLASMEPLNPQSAEDLASHMPESARRDLLEWTPNRDTAAYLGKVVLTGVPAQRRLDPRLEVEITDDDPVNEYFLLRQTGLF
jgi:spermidine synthase